MTSVWDNFGKLVTLKITFPQNSTAKKATIFGNGNNQVPVTINCHVKDKDNADITLTKDELLKVVSLVNYSTGEKIAFDGGRSDIKWWNYSETESDFSTPLGYGLTEVNKVSDVLDSDDYVTLYVSATDILAETEIDIAVQIDVPGVGPFNTTAEGTETKNGPDGKEGSVFKAPSFVHVLARLPVDYSRLDNLHLQQSPWDPVSNQNFTVHDYIIDGAYFEKDNAKLYRRTVKVTPQEPMLKFVEVKFSYKDYYDYDTWTDAVVWHHDKQVGMEVVDKIDANTTAQIPFVAIGGFGVSVGNPDYDTYLWFTPDAKHADSSNDPLNYHVNGFFHLIDSEWQYRTDLDFITNLEISSKTEVALTGYKIHTPTGKNTSIHGWDDVYQPVTFNVTDNYGNKGSFKVAFFHDKSSYESVGDVVLE
ncbi:hypothetical protein XS74_22880 [Salmonella enterica subsp. enterica]|nr:hypothetical protein [Salmonella enterica subsp. enterica]EDT7315835.1 hypothetical protein [Salmonella enterica subsp. enterica]